MPDRNMPGVPVYGGCLLDGLGAEVDLEQRTATGRAPSELLEYERGERIITDCGSCDRVARCVLEFTSTERTVQTVEFDPAELVLNCTHEDHQYF